MGHLDDHRPLRLCYRARRWMSAVTAASMLLLVVLAGASAATGATPRRGGTIVATVGITLNTVDPAYTYVATDWANWVS